MAAPIPTTRSEGGTLAARGQSGRYSIPTAVPAGDSTAAKLLTFVLSMIAGSVDAIGFLGLDGLFTAHITGNIVIVAARFFAGTPAPIAHLLSVPVFIASLFTTRLAATVSTACAYLRWRLCSCYNFFYFPLSWLLT